MKVTSVILCGVSGTRLWPLSRTLYPRQFMNLYGNTLFGDTVRRTIRLSRVKPPLVVCNDSQRFFAGLRLQGIGEAGTIILAPETRNEKPDTETAVAMLREGGYSWNSGMFN